MGFKVFSDYCLDADFPKEMKRSLLKLVSIYDDLFDECLKYGIIIFITLSHFEIPYHLTRLQWLEKSSGD